MTRNAFRVESTVDSLVIIPGKVVIPCSRVVEPEERYGTGLLDREDEDPLNSDRPGVAITGFARLARRRDSVHLDLVGRV